MQRCQSGLDFYQIQLIAGPYRRSDLHELNGKNNNETLYKV